MKRPDTCWTLLDALEIEFFGVRLLDLERVKYIQQQGKGRRFNCAPGFPKKLAKS